MIVLTFHDRIPCLLDLLGGWALPRTLVPERAIENLVNVWVWPDCIIYRSCKEVSVFDFDFIILAISQ